MKYPINPLLNKQVLPSNQQQEHESNQCKRTRPSLGSSVDPNDLVLLKVIGSGTFAQQVALARHDVKGDLYAIKSLNKEKLKQRKQVVHTLAEKKVLTKLGSHPFIVKLYDTFQTKENCHLVLEYCQGGELFYHLQQCQNGKFIEQQVRFYGAEVLSALAFLHANGVLYRDLKPENVLLDTEGHVRLVDFGFCKDGLSKNEKTFSFCGSPEYLSPEMIDRRGHSFETDMWSYGCFLYELATGESAFPNKTSNLNTLFSSIQQARVYYPSYLSGSLVNLIQKCLTVNPSERLTAAEAKEMGFFQSINWEKVEHRQLEPPIKPIGGQDSTDNFDGGFTCQTPIAVHSENNGYKKQCLTLKERMSQPEEDDEDDLFLGF